MIFHRRAFPDAEPVPLPEAVRAALGSVRLAWEADRKVLEEGIR